MKKPLKREYNISDLISKTGVFSDGDWIESKDQDPNGEVRLIQLADIGDGVFINKSKRFLTLKRAQELKCTFLKKGDILIARMPDPIGRACIFPGSEQPCVTAVDVGIIRPENNAVQNKWLKYKINSPHFRHLIKEYTTGTTRKRISRKNLDKITFKLPSYVDQIKIVQILSKAEQLIIERKKSVVLLNELVRSHFLELFGDPRSKSTKWTNLTLGSLGVWKSGGTPPRNRKDFFKGNIPWVTSGELNEFKISDSKEKITQEAIEISNSKLIEVGSILLGMYDTAALKSSISDSPICCNQAIAYSKLDEEKCDTIYVFYFIQIGKEHFKRLQRGVRQQNLNLTMIRNIPLFLPPINLQRKFSDFVLKVEQLKNHLKSSLIVMENFFSTMTQLAFEGKLELAKVKIEKTSMPSLSAFDGKPELEKAALENFNRILQDEYDELPNFSENEVVNSKLKMLEQEKRIKGIIPLDVDYLKIVLKKDFQSRFRAQALYELLKNESIDFEYDQLVKLLFQLLRGRKPFLKQKYFETHSHELPELKEDQKSGGLYLMLNKE